MLIISVSALKAVFPKWSLNFGPKMAVIINKIAVLWFSTILYSRGSCLIKFSYPYPVTDFTVRLYRKGDEKVRERQRQQVVSDHCPH